MVVKIVEWQDRVVGRDKVRFRGSSSMGFKVVKILNGVRLLSSNDRRGTRVGE